MRTQAIRLALAVVLNCPFAPGQWVQQNSGTTRNLYAVHFSDVNTGTVVGDSGTILRTTNGGAIWKSQPSGTFKSLAGVSFTDANTGTVVGDSGTILRTSNGGATWIPQSSGSSLSLCGVCFTDASNGTVVGGRDQGLILHTTNGGVTWTKQFETDSNSINSVSFTDGNTGTAVGGGWNDAVGWWYTILRTTDGGATWRTQIRTQPGFGSDILECVVFADSNTGTAVGGVWGSGDMPYSSYLILRTTDGGATWTTETKKTKAGNGFNCVFFTDANTGTVVGALGRCSNDLSRLDNILRTTDGGATWTPQPSGTTNVLRGVYFVDASTGTVVGDYGTILHTTNGGVASVERGLRHQFPQQYVLSQNYPNPFNPTTTIRYGLPQQASVTITLFNTLGQLVATLVNESQTAGYHEAKFDGTGFASGVYLYRIQAGEFVQMRKLLLLK